MLYSSLFAILHMSRANTFNRKNIKKEQKRGNFFILSSSSEGVGAKQIINFLYVSIFLAIFKYQLLARNNSKNQKTKYRSMKLNACDNYFMCPFILVLF